MSKPKEQKGRRTARFILQITQDGKTTSYTVRPISHQVREFLRCYQVDRGDGTVYHVTQEYSGKRDCDCGARTFHDDKPCKHIKSLEVIGLILPPREVQAIRWHSERQETVK